MLTNKLLKEFGNLENFTKFMREAINDGEQISKGKLGDDDTKEKKKAEAPEKPDPAGDAGEEGGDEGGEAPEGGEGGDAAAAGAAEEPVVDPVEMPGSQVKMGGMTRDDKKDKDIENPDAVEIKLSGKVNKIKKNPTVELDPTQDY